MRIYTNAIAFYFLRFQWWKGREDNEEIEGNRYYQEIIICCYYKIENHLTHMRVLHQTIEIACSAPILVCLGRNSKSSSSPYYDHNRRTILNPILIVCLTLFHLMIAWLTNLYTITSFILTTQQLITTPHCYETLIQSAFMFSFIVFLFLLPFF